MNGVLMFCELLATWTIVGAVETSPGWLHIDYLDQNQNVDFMLIDKDIYLECDPDIELQ